MGYGNAVLRVYSFNPGQNIGELGLFTQEGAGVGETTALYSSVVAFSERNVYIPPAYSNTVSGVFVLSSDIPPGAEFVEFEVTPVVGGVLQPINPLDPPAEVHLVINGYYAGGVAQVGAYSGGEFFVMGEHEFAVDSWNWVGTIPLSALPPPQAPAFWTEIERAIEIVEA